MSFGFSLFKIPLEATNRLEEDELAAGMRITLLPRLSTPTPPWFRLKLSRLPEFEFVCPGKNLVFRDGVERREFVVGEEHYDMPDNVSNRCPYEFVPPFETSMISEQNFRVACAVTCGLRLLVDLDDEIMLRGVDLSVLATAMWLARVCGLSARAVLAEELDARGFTARKPLSPGLRRVFVNPVSCKLFTHEARVNSVTGFFSD